MSCKMRPQNVSEKDCKDRMQEKSLMRLISDIRHILSHIRYDLAAVYVFTAIPLIEVAIEDPPERPFIHLS